MELGEERDDVYFDKLRNIQELTGSKGLLEEELADLQDHDRPRDVEFDGNLALLMDETELRKISQELIEHFEEDYQSRQDWFERETKGIRLLGVSENVDGGADFEGASTVVHPVLMEACIQYQARAIGHLWPATGPVKTIVLGDSTPEREQQAARVSGYMNYQYMHAMPGAFDVEDQLQMRLPLSGSCFKKIHRDYLYGPITEMVAGEDFVVPYNASTLRTSPRSTHILRLGQNEAKRRVAAGEYRETSLHLPDEERMERLIYNEIKKVEGREDTNRFEDSRFTFLEMSVDLDLSEYEQENPGYDLPYIVTLDYDNLDVLAIRRNWEPGNYEKLIHFSHRKFLPGLGFYGFGFLHVIGSLAKAATGALRALLDSAQFANLPGGFKSKEAKVPGGNMTVPPGTWKDVEMTGDDMTKAFFPLPYKEPSQVLLELLGILEGVARRIASTTDTLVGEGANSVPVGTTLARIEQGEKIYSAIHKRQWEAMSEEFTILARVDRDSLPEDGYPYDVPGESRTIAREDFDDRVDVMPVADPNVVSSTQRIIQTQALAERATAKPHLYNEQAVERRVLNDLRIPDPDELLKNSQPPPAMGPVQENMAMQQGQPVRARPEEHHEAHMVAHQVWFELQENEELAPAYEAHMAEHRAWAYYLQLAAEIDNEEVRALIMEDRIHELPPDIQQELAIIVAEASQNLALPPSPEAQEQAREDDRKDAATAADIERKDLVASADIIRNEQESASKRLTDILETEQKMRDAQIDREVKKRKTA